MASMDMPPSSYGVLNRQVINGEAGAWLWAQAAHRLWATMPEHFWVYVYKVRKCPQPGSHDWTCCPYAHKGERARRRDPQRYNYLAVSCPDHPGSNGGGFNGSNGFKGSCRRGLRCKYAHGVFELWLHPARFRTRMCEAGARCPRRICFFAHFRSQLREAGNSACSDSVSFLPPRILQRSALPASYSPAPAPAPSAVSALAAAARDHDMGNQFGLQDVANRLQLLSLRSANNGGGGMISAFSAAAAAAPVPELQAVVAPPPPFLGGGGRGISVFSAAAPTPELLMVAPREAGGSARACGGGGDDDEQYPHVDLINDLVD